MLGYTGVSILDGGVEGWKNAGYEVVEQSQSQS
jgi:3-mercaptopyruvate sulfurtransferase SseA